MAVKYKEDKNTEFKSLDRDIREHQLSDSDFDLGFTDSTCPFGALVEEIYEPGEEYTFALNSPERIDRLLARKWSIVSPDRLQNKRTYRSDKRADNDCITTGDTIVLTRDQRYGDKERKHYDDLGVRVVRDSLQRIQTDVFNPLQPFSDKSYKN